MQMIVVRSRNLYESRKIGVPFHSNLTLLTLTFVLHEKSFPERNFRLAFLIFNDYHDLSLKTISFLEMIFVTGGFHYLHVS